MEKLCSIPSTNPSKSIEKAINKKTVAIMVPNLIGNIADWKKLRFIADKYKLKLIEDSADTIGYKYIYSKKYKKADVCTTSFYASHILKTKYKMNPLTITWAPTLYTDWGWRNFQKWPKNFV